MNDIRSPQRLSRRSALAGMGTGGVGLALAGHAGTVSAKVETITDHPLTGVWLSMADDGVSVYQFVADGTVTLTLPTCWANKDGDAAFSSSGIGTWQKTGAQTGYFNVVHVLSTAAGAFAGTLSVHGFPVVAEDGSAISIDGSEIRIYARDAKHLSAGVTGADGSLASVSAIRMRPGSPGFPGPYGSPAEQ